MAGFEGINVETDAGFVSGIYQFLYSPNSSSDNPIICVYLKGKN